MNTKEIMECADEHLIHVYNRYKIVLDHGDGVYLYDKDGKEYLDFGAGIAVFAFGYNNKEFNDAIKAQVDKLIHTSNLFYNEPAAEAAKALAEIAGMDKVFFTNSGTEAIEGAVKVAKKYGYLKTGHDDNEIIAFSHSFHGRSMGALSVTGNKSYQIPFGPLIPDIKFANYNDLDSVKELVTDKTCAIILETVQGEGGIYPADKEFLTGLRKLCDENDMLLILDEIQCGLGRTGTMYAYEQYGVIPDVVSTAKALGQGLPVGAFLTRGKANDVLVPGDHGSTYGGNPLAGAAVIKTLEMFKTHDILNHVNETAPYLEKKLEELVEKHDIVTGRRGKGFMQGITVTVPPSKIINKAIENGLIVFSAGHDVVRFVPPLVITKEDIDEMYIRLDKALSEVE
ncbi:MAG: aspartate aminotransferase family protein [Lachnospiraceae bacterium]|nr:aspartate aminotransferase family protein [Lachnospiraceae bacterium]